MLAQEELGLEKGGTDTRAVMIAALKAIGKKKSARG